jgi:hypothetical protein
MTELKRLTSQWEYFENKEATLRNENKTDTEQYQAVCRLIKKYQALIDREIENGK